MIRFLTAGESHGKALVGIIEGLPAGLELTTEHITAQLMRRKAGYGRGNRQNIENEELEILAGVRHGRTIGSPIAVLLPNKDWRAWTDIMQAEPFDGAVKRRVDVPRPGHADLVGGMKYGFDDMRNVLERSSARETAMRVAMGAIARTLLEALGIAIGSRVVRVGSVVDPSVCDVSAAELNARTDASPLRILDRAYDDAFVAEVDRAKAAGDTLGGIFEVIADGVPLGIGSYAQWDRRLEAGIGEAFLSLNAIKGVEIGMGFALGTVPGSQAHDEFFPGAGPRVTRQTNRSGGIDGGMATGEPLVVRAAMKPIATLMKPLASVDLRSGEAVKAHVERSDTCAVPAAAVIGEALLALTLANAMLDKFGGDAMDEVLPRVHGWRELARTR